VVDRAESSASFVPTLELGLPSASTESSLREELLALLARLFLSLLSLVELEPDVPRLRLLLELLDPAPTGLSKSKPNCSNERLKEVAFAGRVR
jgi:hypothetical protein